MSENGRVALHEAVVKAVNLVLKEFDLCTYEIIGVLEIYKHSLIKDLFEDGGDDEDAEYNE